MKNVIISNQNFQKIKERIISDGRKNLHVIADFDKTLTKAFVDLELVPSIFSELRNGNILGNSFSKEAKKLYKKYHPIELDHSIDEEIRDAKMNEWWSKVFDLLKKEGVNKSHLREVANRKNIQLRQGVQEFLKFLRDMYIPLIILSASAIGELISIFLESKGLLYNNITIISNFFDWDSEGNMKSHIGPIIHSENKGEVSIEKFPIFEKIKERRNVLLLGDSLGDVEMIGKFPYENILKFGFLNEDVEKRLSEYKKRYDCVITDDGNFNSINKFLISIKK